MPATETTSQPALKIRGLNKDFIVGGRRVPVLHEIDLTVSRGRFISIVGASGCGKSTLLRIIGGLDNSHSGTVELDGEPIRGPGLERGLVFQEPRLFPWLTVTENIAFGLSGSKQEKREQVEHLLRLVGLAGFASAYPHQLSGGMAQRAAIARAIINRPEILLMDEPFGALDAFTRIQMQEGILNIWRNEGATVVLVTHDIEEAIFLGDRVLVMSNRPGTIRATYEVPISRPRDRNGPDFVELRRHIYGEFFAQSETPFAYTI